MEKQTFALYFGNRGFMPAELIEGAREDMVKALADALNSGKIYAADLDAVRNEPISEDNPLLKAKNRFITPHISWAAVEGRQRLASFAIDTVKAFLDGAPINIVKELL